MECFHDRLLYYGELGRAINGKHEFHSTTCSQVALKENNLKKCRPYQLEGMTVKKLKLPCPQAQRVNLCQRLLHQKKKNDPSIAKNN